MPISMKAEAPPIRVDESGGLRVGNTRVLLDLVVIAFQNGATPEDIVRSYDTLSLADVYAVIAYYLRHRAEIDAYIAEGERQFADARQRSESRGEFNELRERMEQYRKDRL